MSWKEEVLLVVDEMLAEAKDLEGVTDAASSYTRSTLRGYARTLKAICGSAADNPPPPRTAPPAIGTFPFMGANPLISPELQTFLEVEKAKAEFRNKKKTEMIEEAHDGDGVMLHGGPAEGTMHIVHPQMPAGSLIEIGGAMYQLAVEDGVKKLIFHEKKTEELQLVLLRRNSGN